LQARLAEIQQGIAVTPKLGKNTIAEGLQSVIQDQKVNDRRSIKETEQRIALHILQHFDAKRPMSTITTGDLRV
jgi:hypothetical protein